MSLRICLLAIACLTGFAIGRATAEEPRFLGRTRLEWIDILETSQRRQRSHAAWAIQEFAVERADGENSLLWLNELLLLTESPSPSVRYWGTLGLGRLCEKLEPTAPARIKGLEALPPLLKDSSSAVRIAAADALLSASDKAAALAVLVESLSNPQEGVRIQAVTALERWGEAARPAVASLRQAATDSSEYVKRISTRALEKLDGRTP
jgi:HEAT repeat protein